MTRALVLVLAVFGWLSAALWVAVAQPAEETRTVTGLGAEFQVPATWSKTASEAGKGALRIVEPDQGDGAAVIDVFMGDSLENTELEGLISRVVTEVAGHPAHRYDWKDDENRGFVVVLQAADKSGKHLTLSFRGPLPRWKELKPAFSAALASLMVDDTASGGLAFKAPRGWSKAEFKRDGAVTRIYRNPTPSPDGLSAVTVTEIASADGSPAQDMPQPRHRFEDFLGRFAKSILAQAVIDDVDEDELAGQPALTATLSGERNGEAVNAAVMLVAQEAGVTLVSALAGADSASVLDDVKRMFAARGTGDLSVQPMAPFDPGPRQVSLFNGKLDERWQENEAAGGRYADHARFEDGALTVRVPEQNGWAKVGLLSRAPLVWLDEFGDGAEIVLTFAYDPARTTGLGIAIGPGRAYDAWSMPGVYIQWNVAKDGAAGILSVVRRQEHRPGSPFFRKGETVAPEKVTVRIRHRMFIVEVAGFDPVEVPDETLEPSTGLYINVFSSVPEPHLATSMALTGITMERTPGAPLAEPKPAAGVEPLPTDVLFPTQDRKAWVPMAVAGGDFAKHARLGKDGLEVRVPENSQWGKVGILTRDQILSIDPNVGLAPYRLRFTLDPAKTRAVKIALKGAHEPDIDWGHWISAGIIENDADTVTLFLHHNDSGYMSRVVPRAFGSTMDVVFSRDRVTVTLENGAAVSAPVGSLGNYYPLWLAVMANPSAENEPTSFGLRKVELTRVPPDGMDKATRWLFVKDGDFDAGEFLDEIADEEETGQQGWRDDGHLLRLAAADTIRSDAPPGWRMAQSDPAAESEDDIRKRIEERMSRLNQAKLDALMAHIGREPPKDFYACLCSTMWRAGHVGVSYRNGRCHFSGFGEWDEPLPNDPATWASCIDSQRYEDGTSLVDVLAGEVKALRDKKKAAADEAAKKKEEAAKGPDSSVADYDKLLAKNLTALRLKGYPMNRIEQLNAMVRRHIMSLDQPGELPGFWESLGLARPDKADAAALDSWRKAMLEKWDKRFIGLLEGGDPKAIMEGIRQTSQALGNYDAGMKLAAEGALDEVAGNQKFVEDVMSAIPVVGDTMDLIAVAGYIAGNGDWTLTGDEVTGFDALLRFAALAGPLALDKLLASSKTAAHLADDLGTAAHALGDGNAAKAVGKAVGRSADEVSAGVKNISEAVAKERKAAADALLEKANAAGKSYAETAEGLAELNRQKLDRKLAGELVDRLKTAKPGTPAFEDALRQLQSNKMAQTLINAKDIPDELRQVASAGVKRWYDVADTGTKQGIKELLGSGDEAVAAAKRLGVDSAEAAKLRKQMQDYANKFDPPLDLDDFKVDVKTITNKRPGDAGAVKTTSFGRDRDVTFEIVAPDGRRFDVDHTVSKDIYEQNFWKASKGQDIPMKNGVPDKDIIGEYAHEAMDQTVTSKWHVEAYNPGEVKLDDFLDKGVQPTITRVEDVRDTVIEKSADWFHRAEQATNPTDAARNLAEGMRQASKQYDDLIMSRLKQYGMNPAAVPPQLQAAMDVFKQVKNLEVTPKQAEAMLAAIGTSPDKVVRDIGSMFETMEKFGGSTFRANGLSEVASSVKSLASAGTPGWQSSALSTINDGLRTGKLTGPDFLKLRGSVIADVKRSLSGAELGEWARQARDSGLISRDEFDLLW